jgi:hypothetical protein
MKTFARLYTFLAMVAAALLFPMSPVYAGDLETSLVHTDLGANHHMWTKARVNGQTGHLEANTRYATFTWFGGYRGGAQIAFVDSSDYIIYTTHAEIHGVDGTLIGRSDWTVAWSEDIPLNVVAATDHMVVVHYWADNWMQNLNNWLNVGKRIAEAVAEIITAFGGQAGSGR